MARIRSHYEVLEVNRTASPEAIRGAYKYLSSKFHPDRNPRADAARRMQELNVAYEVLSDTKKRKAYDAWLREQEGGAAEEDSEAEERESSPTAARSRSSGFDPDRAVMHCNNPECPGRRAGHQPQLRFACEVDVGVTTLFRYHCPHCHRQTDFTSTGFKIAGVTPGIQVAGQLFGAWAKHAAEEHENERRRMENPAYAALQLRLRAEGQERERRFWRNVWLAVGALFMFAVVASLVNR